MGIPYEDLEKFNTTSEFVLGPHTYHIQMILKTARDLKNISTRLPTAPSSHKTAHIVILSILKSEIRKPKAEKTPTV